MIPVCNITWCNQSAQQVIEALFPQLWLNSTLLYSVSHFHLNVHGVVITTSLLSDKDNKRWRTSKEWYKSISLWVFLRLGNHGVGFCCWVSPFHLHLMTNPKNKVESSQTGTCRKQALVIDALL